jgi:tetratricopeptide (TPR) repeat protein
VGFPRIRIALVLLAVLALGVTARPRAASIDVASWLTRYAAGDFAVVVSEMERAKDPDEILKQLKKDAPTWIAAGGPTDRARREIAAATFALEAARVSELDEWKLLQPFMGLMNIYWKAPPQLIEWGCVLLRGETNPPPIERVWHLAALSVADRANDFEFLLGSPWEDRANRKDEIVHLTHAVTRFPFERRFALAQGIAVEWRLFPSRRPGSAEAQKIFEILRDDPSVGAEASVRLGLMHSRNNNATTAFGLFATAEQRSREPYVIYLSRYLRGQLLEKQKKTSEAERQYRAALNAVPAAQSASFALSSLLALQGHRADAANMVDAALTANPRPIDPWRAYGEADARFWPELIAQLHAEIAR